VRLTLGCRPVDLIGYLAMIAAGVGLNDAGRNVVERLTSKPGIREQYRPICDIDRLEIPQRSSPLCAMLSVGSTGDIGQ
jgi:hypothetical protein